MIWNYCIWDRVGRDSTYHNLRYMTRSISLTYQKRREISLADEQSVLGISMINDSFQVSGKILFLKIKLKISRRFTWYPKKITDDFVIYLIQTRSEAFTNRVERSWQLVCRKGATKPFIWYAAKCVFRFHLLQWFSIFVKVRRIIYSLWWSLTTRRRSY